MTAVAIDATTVAGTFSVQARFTADVGVTALFGPSGAGKSVTLATIAGLLRPAGGTVTLQGQTVADPENGLHVRTQERHVGMVFQQAALIPHRSPLDNVALAVSDTTDRRARRARAHDWLLRVQAGHLADAPTSTLSGGEQQRVALARALAAEPSILLLDEPFSALDLPHRNALRGLVRELVDDQRITALVVTHDLSDITRLADRVVLFEPGRTIGSHDVPRADPAALAELLGVAPSSQ